MPAVVGSTPDFVAEGMPQNPSGRAAAPERSAGDASGNSKNRESIPPPMVDDPTSAALHRRRDHLRRAYRGVQTTERIGSRDVARAVRIHRRSGVSAAVYPASTTGAKRGSPSLALGAALVHTF